MQGPTLSDKKGGRNPQSRPKYAFAHVTIQNTVVHGSR